MKTCSNGVPFARRPCVCQSGPRLMAIYGPPKGGGGRTDQKSCLLQVTLLLIQSWLENKRHVEGLQGGVWTWTTIFILAV